MTNHKCQAELQGRHGPRVVHVNATKLALFSRKLMAASGEIERERLISAALFHALLQVETFTIDRFFLTR